MIMFNENQATAIAESERSDQRNGGIHFSFSCKNEDMIYVISLIMNHRIGLERIF